MIRISLQKFPYFQETTVRQNVVREFTSLYLHPIEDEPARMYPVRAAKELIGLVMESNAAQMASIEELVCRVTVFMQSGL